MSEESPKRKFICLHCGSTFESEKEAPQCPNCHRRKVMPFDLFVQSIERNKDKLREMGVLPEFEDKLVTPEVATTSSDVAGSNDSGVNDTPVPTAGGTGVNVAEPVRESGTSVITADVPVTSEESTVTGDVDRDAGDTPESDELLMKYLRDLDDEPEVKPKSSPSRKKRRPRKVTVPVGRSLVEVLLFIGLVVLLYKWWTSRQSAPSPSSNVDQVDRPRYGSTYEMINRNIGHRTLG